MRPSEHLDDEGAGVVAAGFAYGVLDEVLRAGFAGGWLVFGEHVGQGVIPDAVDDAIGAKRKRSPDSMRTEPT